MSTRKSGGRKIPAVPPAAEKQAEADLALRCAILPAQMRLHKDLKQTQAELEKLIAGADAASKLSHPPKKAGTAASHPHAPAAGVLGADRGKAFASDALANLWFVRAAQEFGKAAMRDPAFAEHADYARTVLLPICRHIVQDFISDAGIGGVRMDDGGLLADIAPAAANAATEPAATRAVESAGARGSIDMPLRINALWYAALEGTGAVYRLHSWTPGQATAAAGGRAGGSATGGPGGRDAVGDHFERLAGRFRRAFAKAYWCDQHNRICPPPSRALPDHGPLPDIEQVLLTMLPTSPLPLTKQKQIRLQIQTAALGAVGLRLEHPQHGPVESPLHLAWLAQGAAITAESAAEREQALLLARPLATLWPAAKSTGLVPFYKDGNPLPGLPPDPLTTAEVLATLTEMGTAQ